MNPEAQNFFRNILHQIVYGGINAILFRLPWPITLLLVLAAIGLITYFGIY
ncbi:MAG: hypothetical protein ACRCZF_00400 [Gemmataceae bacterium]